MGRQRATERHSSRRAMIGSTRAARSAGTAVAHAAVSSSRIATLLNVAGSRGLDAEQKQRHRSPEVRRAHVLIARLMALRFGTRLIALDHERQGDPPAVERLANTRPCSGGKDAACHARAAPNASASAKAVTAQNVRTRRSNVSVTPT